MNAHENCHETWTVRPATECYADGKTPIDCMWVYDCKVDATTEKFLLWKARLVGRGDQMVYLRDYLSTSIRTQEWCGMPRSALALLHVHSWDLL